MRPRKIGRWILAAALLGIAGWGASHAWRNRRVPPPPPAAPVPPPVIPDDSTARAPDGVRIRVQVVNATRTRGLARRATKWLRGRGFDVVEVATTSEQLDSSLVLDRSGHAEWARRAARAMGGARMESRPDSSRYLDLTVLVGRAWRPPAEPLDP
ncbi:MAG: LytR C-terminal domain-containing protein [Gemmatirosa sp.]|nr:LytR C-terminal domain-containing protein [Gemmatirosa sp.]